MPRTFRGFLKAGILVIVFILPPFGLAPRSAFPQEKSEGTEAGADPAPEEKPDQVDRAREALRRDDSHPARWRALAFTFMARDEPGDRGRAVETARLAMERFPDDPAMIALYARTLLHGGEYGPARHAARRALAADLSNGEAHFVLGQVLLGEWKLEEAQRELEIGADMLRTDPDPYFQLAILYERRKLYPLAADTWEIHQRLLRGESKPFGRPDGADEGRVALLRSLGARTPFAVEGRAVSTTVPMRAAKSGLYLIRVKANDGPQVWFDIDTGSEAILISRTLFRKLRLREISRTAITGIGGKVESSGTAVLDRLQIGNFRIRNVPVEVLDRFPRHKGKPVSGSIGQSLLREFIVTLNFPAGNLTLALPRRRRASEYWEPPSRVRALKHSIPMRYPSVTAGSWEGGGEIPLLWDTGAGLSVLDVQQVAGAGAPVDLEHREHRGKDGVGNVIAYRKTAEPSRFFVDDLVLPVRPAVIDLRRVNRHVPYLGGIIGTDVMRDYIVTFDYFRGELRLMRGAPGKGRGRTGP